MKAARYRAAFADRVPLLTTPQHESTGVPVRVHGETFQEKLGAKDNADDVARVLFRRSRGEKGDSFDYPIIICA
jgi:hypothetical protein